jgi:hypothetical protein
MVGAAAGSPHPAVLAAQAIHAFTVAAPFHALRSYTWIEKTEVSLKGEVKNTSLQSCRYGPDGKVQKTPLSAPAEPEEQGRGRKKKIAN